MKRIQVPWSCTSTAASGSGSGSYTSSASTNFIGSCLNLEDWRPQGLNQGSGPQALDTFPAHSARTPTGKANANSVIILIPQDAAAVDVLPRPVVKGGFNSGDDHVSLWLFVRGALLKDTGLSGKGIGAVHSAHFAVLTLPKDPVCVCIQPEDAVLHPNVHHGRCFLAGYRAVLQKDQAFQKSRTPNDLESCQKH